MGATFSPTLAGLGGTISDTQHGARTGPNDAHEYADITGLAAHAARHNSGGADALAGDAAAATASLRTLGSGAAQAAAGTHAHTRVSEAKLTAGAAASESVTWTTAFAVAPIVQTTAFGEPTYESTYANVASRSTTGATVLGKTPAGDAAVKKFVTAQEAT